VSVVTVPGNKQVGSLRSTENVFEFDLPPGDYKLQCTGNGSLGATFEPTYMPFTVKAGEQTLDLGTIDMPASATTRLFGKAAPELKGIAQWKNTDPVSIKELKDKIIVLDFWAYTCSICIHHMPELAELAEKYPDKLAVLTIHDGSLESVAEIQSTLSDVALKKLGKLPIALDAFGAESVFQAYGMRAVPALILIDAKGTVVRRFHHAGDPELEKSVKALIESQK
jgi:thiol-disulfide isomerase/thioredoxin